jgi:hypothetical protein
MCGVFLIASLVLATHRTVGARSPLAALGSLRALRPIAPFRPVNADDSVVAPGMTPVRTVVAPAMLTVPVLDFLDLGGSHGDLRKRRLQIGGQHQAGHEQGRDDLEMLHDSTPPYRLTR